jgi:hypothetical protein
LRLINEELAPALGLPIDSRLPEELDGPWWDKLISKQFPYLRLRRGLQAETTEIKALA